MQLFCDMLWCSLGKPWRASQPNKPQCKSCRYIQQNCRLHAVAASIQALGLLPACCRNSQSRLSKHAHHQPMQISVLPDELFRMCVQGTRAGCHSKGRPIADMMLSACRVYTEVEELHQDYESEVLHPSDLKPALSAALNAILQPVREHFERDDAAKQLLKQVKSFKVTK